MRQRWVRETVAILLLLLGGGGSGVWAQWERAIPTAAQEPKIDGRIEPAEWQGATTIEDFRQVEPTEGATPSERTVIHLMVDARHLYIGLECFDSDPAGVRGTQVKRDANLDPDDRVEMVLDTFWDRRNAYFFQIGPGGSKGDALIGSNGAFFNKQWDGIWRGRAHIGDFGWSAELAIPAQTLTFNPGQATWGFNARRFVKRKNEVAQWASPDRTHSLFNIASAGVVTGLEHLEPGLGLDFKPYVRGDLRDVDGENPLDGDAGFDLRYQITPGLVATLTVNTDFAETEVDERIVNLSRFPVFFPEKRDFFLEDATIFRFANLRSDALPFFSRRIGLDASGEEVRILAGGKLTGRVGDWNIGLLSVGTESTGDLDSKFLSVARIARNILEQSQVGVIATYGDPQSNGDNALLGADFTYRTDTFLEDRNLRIDAWAQGTWDDPDSGDGGSSNFGYAYGLSVDYPNDVIDAEIGYREISDDFEPELGFVRRSGERRILGDVNYRPRPGGAIRRFRFGAQSLAWLDIDDGEINSYSLRLIPLGIDFESGDEFRIDLTPRIERLVGSFEISDGVVIPSGRYDFVRFGVELESSDKRPLAGRIGFETGSYYDGERDEYEVEVVWRPRPGFEIEAGYEHNRIELRDGNFTTNLVRLRTQVDFSPDISWSTTFQYDDVSDNLGINSRFRWIIEPGNDLFVVFNQGYRTEDDEGRFTFDAPDTEVTVKVSLTFRF